MAWYSSLASVASFSWRCTKAVTKFTVEQIGWSGPAVMLVGAGVVAVGATVLAGVPATVATIAGGVLIAAPPALTVFEAAKLAVKTTYGGVETKINNWRAGLREAEQAANEGSKRLAEASRQHNERLDKLIPTMETNAKNFQEAMTFMQTRQQENRERIQTLEQQDMVRAQKGAELRIKNAVLESKLEQLESKLEQMETRGQDGGKSEEAKSGGAESGGAKNEKAKSGGAESDDESVASAAPAGP